jgi:hypothetical protein
VFRNLQQRLAHAVTAWPPSKAEGSRNPCDRRCSASKPEGDLAEGAQSTALTIDDFTDPLEDPPQLVAIPARQCDFVLRREDADATAYSLALRKVVPGQIKRSVR